jgi:hypothetical protein
MTAPPGSYYATVSAPGFVVVVDGKPFPQTRPWILSPGEEGDALNFEIQPGGSITGKVTSADGKPLIETMMTLLPERPANMQPFPSLEETWSSVRTDDRGIYRFYGVPSGVYRVAAGAKLAAWASMRGRPALVRVFYPDVLDEAKAKTIVIKGGEEVTGIDIRMLPPESVFSVKGKVVDETTGQPISNVSLGLRIYSGETTIGGRNDSDYSNADGEFEINDVPPGRYSLYAPANNMTGGPKGVANSFGDSAIFDVVDQDVSGIVVKTERTAAISGWVTLEGSNNQSQASSLQNLTFIVTTEPVAHKGRFGTQWFVLAPDGTFAIGGVFPGKLNFQVLGSPKLKVLRVEHNDSFEPVELRPGDKIGGLKVVLGEASAIVRGSIKLTDGPLPDKVKGSVGLYTEKRMVGYALLDEHGRFAIENVPAGSYRLIVNVAIPGMSPVSTHNEQAITVGNAQVSEVVVALDPKPAP